MQYSIGTKISKLHINITPQQIITIGFAILILSGTLMLMLPISYTYEQKLSWINALFTATSAVSLTGLTVVDIEPNFSIFGQIIILILVKLSGLGFMMF